MTRIRFTLLFLGIVAVLPSAGAQPAPIKAHGALVHAVAVSPDGKTLATAGFDNVVKLWEIADDGTLKEKKTLTGHTGPVYAVAFHPTDAKLIATASQDKTARIWDMTDAKMKTEFKGHADIVDAIAFSPDGKSLATAGADKAVKLWNQTDGKELKALGVHDGSVYSLAFSPDGKLLASAGAGKDNLVKIWDVKEQKELTQLKGHEQPVTAVVFAGNELVVTASMDRTIRTWTTKGAASAPKDPPKDPKVDPKKDPKVDPKDPKKDPKDPPKEMKDPKELKKFGPTTDDPYGIAWHEKTKTAAVCGYSGQITTWALDADKPKFTRTIKNPGYCVAFTLDGKSVITGHDNGTVAVTPLGK